MLSDVDDRSVAVIDFQLEMAICRSKRVALAAAAAGPELRPRREGLLTPVKNGLVD